jgi:manganese-dependent inorganic pyrophosphatase
MPAGLVRCESVREESSLDKAYALFSNEVEAVAEALKQRAVEGVQTRVDGERLHPTAYIEMLTAEISLPAGCLFVGHTNTDLDSVGGAVGAAELYDGRACLAQAPQDLNGEIMYAISYARTGETPDWAALDIETWRASAAGGEGSMQALKSFGTVNRGSLAVFDDVFTAANPRPRVCMVDHNAPSQMVPALKKALVEDGDTSCLAGIIDHHALDEGIFTKAPLFMDVRPWGSMSTIVAHSFIRSAKPIPVDVARLLLCAIMSDTVNLTSPTTTQADKYIVPLLASFCCEPDHNRLAQQLFKAKTAWYVTLSPFEVVRADQKNFSSACVDNGHAMRWGWATVEVNEPGELLAQTEALLLELHYLKQEAALKFVFLSVVDLTTKRSTLLLCGDGEASLAQAAFPDGRLFSSALPHPPDGRLAPKRESERASLRQLGIGLASCAMDVGSRTSRKKEFKPAIDDALMSGWSLDDTLSAPEGGKDTDADAKEGGSCHAGGGKNGVKGSRLCLQVETRIDKQRIERNFTVTATSNSATPDADLGHQSLS